jgi:hypothetical protein
MHSAANNAKAKTDGWDNITPRTIGRSHSPASHKNLCSILVCFGVAKRRVSFQKDVRNGDATPALSS